KSKNRLNGVQFHPKSNTLIAYGNSDTIIFYDAKTLKNLGGIESKNDKIFAIAISNDGQYLATGGDDGYVEIWNLNSYQLLHRMKNSSDDTFALAFSSDNSKLASAGESEVVDIWNVNAGQQIAQLEGHTDDINSISFIDYDRKLVSSAEDKKVKIWDVIKKRELYSYVGPSNEYGDIHKAKSFDDHTILTTTDVETATGNSRNRNGPPVWSYPIKVKDNQGNVLNEFDQHRGPVTAIDIAKDRSYLASISEDKTIRLWDLEHKSHITNIVLSDKGHSVSINASGNLLAAVEGEKTIKVWQINNAYSQNIGSQNSVSTAPSSNSGVSSWYRKQYAVVVGINHYKKPSIPRLNNAVEDARSVAAILKEQGFSIIELYNENATKQRILEAIREIKKTSVEEDSTLFYFAGHGEGISGHNGVREGYLLPYDFSSDLHNPNPDVMYYDKTAISISSLVMYTRDTKAKHIGILLDSCFSGLAMKTQYASKSLSSDETQQLDHIAYDTKMRSVRIKPTTAKTPSSSNAYQNLLRKKSINILTAGKDQPVSDGSNHSPFTQAILNALGQNINQSGYIRFTTLANYVMEQVKQKTGHQQEPQYRNDSLEDGDFIFKL
nr:caspase family protein [Campylobacterota bacterium]